MDPMFGHDGWCRSCGTPNRAQSGPRIMQGRKFPDAPLWMPNWLFDVVCLRPDIASQVARRFSVKLREVYKPRGSDPVAMQLIAEVTFGHWYDSADLAPAVVARHTKHSGNQAGSKCPACLTWKWLPISEGEAPARAGSLIADTDVIASPEVFGDGLKSFHHLLFRRPLGQFLADAHPRAWSVVEVAQPVQ